MIIAAILACEVGFWLVLAAGLLVRYALRRPRLGGVLPACVPLVDLALLVLTVLDLRRGAPASTAHGLAAVYLGSSVVFGHAAIRYADVRAAHRWAGGPPPPVKPASGTRARRQQEWREFGQGCAAAAISAALLLAAIALAGAGPTPHRWRPGSPGSVSSSWSGWWDGPSGRRCAAPSRPLAEAGGRADDGVSPGSDGYGRVPDDGRGPVLLAHLSDPHLTNGPLAAGPAAGLHAALGRVLGLPTRPDAVVITGDLTDHGRPEGYAQLRDLLADVPLPVHLTTGNHDDRDALRRAFAGTARLGGGEETRYAVDLPGARLVVLDSLVPGSGAGLLGADQLAWLDAVLSERPGAPALLALHHPPVPVGLPFLDGMRLDDGDALAEVVRAHPQVVRVLCGHVHRAVTAPFAGTVVTTAASTHRQSALDMTAPGTMGYLDEPASFSLHQLTDATGSACVTHTVPVSGAAVQFAIQAR